MSLLSEAREAFQLCMDAEADNRAAALDDLRFARLGEQWPAQMRDSRVRQGRPCLTINRLPSFIRQVVNDARQNKPAITVHPADVSTFHYIDNLSRSIRHAGRILIDLIPRVYSAPRMLRVLGPDSVPQVVAVNQPVTVPGGAPGNPGPSPIQRVFDLGLGKYDLTVEAGPSFTTRRQEAAEQMMSFVRAFPQAAPVIGDLRARNLDWPGAPEIARRLSALLPPAAGAGPSPQLMAAQQQIQQLTGHLREAAVQLAEAKASKAMEIAQLELDRRRIEVKAFEATTRRLELEGQTQTSGV